MHFGMLFASARVKEKHGRGNAIFLSSLKFSKMQFGFDCFHVATNNYNVSLTIHTHDPKVQQNFFLVLKKDGFRFQIYL